MKTELSDDALLFGLAFLSRPGHTLEFGGEGAKNEITPRGRAALDELLAAGFVESIPNPTGWYGREHYKTLKPIGPEARGRIDPFNSDKNFEAFQAQ